MFREIFGEFIKDMRCRVGEGSSKSLKVRGGGDFDSIVFVFLSGVALVSSLLPPF